jgi:hypothetical protein
MASVSNNWQDRDVKGLSQNLLDNIQNEWLGIDDFKRVRKKLKEGNFWGAMKSLGAGVFELGGTIAMFTPAAPLAAAGKAGKVSKVLNSYKILKPLSKEDKVIAKLVKANPKFNKRIGKGASKELIEEAIKDRGLQVTAKKTSDKTVTKGLGKKIREAGDAQLPSLQSIKEGAKKLSGMSGAGVGRGGTAGSLIRGIGQLNYATPFGSKPLSFRNAGFAIRRTGSGDAIYKALDKGTPDVPIIKPLGLGLTRNLTTVRPKELPYVPVKQVPIPANLDNLSEEQLLQILETLRQQGYEV